VRRAAEDGMVVLRGVEVEELRELVAEAMEPVLKPLVYAEPLRLVERHRDAGERVYVVSAALQEIVDALVEELGFDGGVGSICESVDGVYTGRAHRACHGAAKADALRALARADGIDLAGSTAYSDSHTDLPFLEAVGRPVAVNADRALRLVAAERGWPVLEFSELLYPRGRRRLPVAIGVPLVVGAGAAVWIASRRAA
jgi:HAD superfamily hydrolase (TIGR01490 family)